MSSTTITPTEPVVVAPVAPAPPTEPQPYTITNKEDGTVHLKLQTGEEFSGTWQDIGPKLAQSKVHTNLSYSEIKSELQKLQEQMGPVVTALQPRPPQPSEQELQEQQLQEYLATQQAKYLGFGSAQEMRESLAEIRGNTIQSQNQMELAKFHAAAPEFPGTPEASDKLMEVAAKYGLIATDNQGKITRFPTHNELMAAHALALREGVYMPLTAEQIAQQRQATLPQSTVRPTPPPVLPGTQPELNGPLGVSPKSVWKMSKQELENLGQQLREAGALR